MSDDPFTSFLRWALPQLGKRWEGYEAVRGQVKSRLADRLQELDLRSLEAYRDYLKTHLEEWERLDAMCRITVSRFYRDPPVFDRLRDDILPTLAEERHTPERSHLRAWRVGAASGEEPYTLRILWDLQLRDHFDGLSFRVVASEAQVHMIRRARRACYQRGTLENLPDPWIEQAFRYDPALDRGKHAEPYFLHPPYRRHVTWRWEDVRKAMPDGPFSFICCRNLAFTYFEPRLQRECMQRLLARLHPGGILVLGADETPPMDRSSLVPVEETLPVYRHCPD